MREMRELIEELLARVRRARDEAEADAEQARTDLVRKASGIAGPDVSLDPDVIRAAADQWAGAIERLRLLDEEASDLRALLR